MGRQWAAHGMGGRPAHGLPMGDPWAANGRPMGGAWAAHTRARASAPRHLEAMLVPFLGALRGHFCNFRVSICPDYLCCFGHVPKKNMFLTVPAPVFFPTTFMFWVSFSSSLRMPPQNNRKMAFPSDLCHRNGLLSPSSII